MSFTHPDKLNKHVIKCLCARYGYGPDRFVDCQEMVATGDYMVSFSSVPVSAAFALEVTKLRTMLLDDLRGSVIKAAVPDLHKVISNMLGAFDDACNRKVVRVPRRDMHDLINNPHQYL